MRNSLVPVAIGGGFNSPVADYRQAMREARYWARIALDNKRDGMEWKDAAKLAHEALRWALMIP